MKALLLVVLAGCGMIQGSSGGSTTPSGGGGTSGGGGAAPAPSGGDPSGKVTMPNLVGKTEAEANAMLAAAGFKSSLEHSSPVDCGDSAPKDPGKINCQNVDAGSQVAAYTLVQVNIYQPQHFEGMLVRHQLEPLRGMTVEAGKAELARLGYHGKIEITHPFQFIDKCGLGKICDIDPEAGISLTDPTTVMHFTVNEDKVKISTPDP
ncbi:MAG TPA: PASTA domain-containing protein [Kofleriaceae bacterium]|nr:PASTA domain-containing protein [Kofleriaceae bacterium]